MAGIFEEQANKMLENGSYEEAMGYLSKLLNESHAKRKKMSVSNILTDYIKGGRRKSLTKHKFLYTTGDHLSNE